jgi:hypothetical protein
MVKIKANTCIFKTSLRAQRARQSIKHKEWIATPFRLAMTMCFLILLLSSISLPAAAKISVSATIDDAKISLDDETSISVQVSGKMTSSDPVIPHVAGLSIVKTGRSSQFQFINGKMSMVAEFIYTVVPEEAGQFKIPAFSVFSGGIEYKTKGLKLAVTKGNYTGNVQGIYNPYQKQNQNIQGNQGNQVVPQTQNGQVPPFWIETAVDKMSLYESEQLLFTFKLYSIVSIQSDKLELPEFNEFWIEELVPERRGQQVIGGKRYATYEKVYALFPLKSGDIKIDEARLKIQYYTQGKSNKHNGSAFNDPFFKMGNRGQLKAKTLRTKPIQIKVNPLPSPIPKDFTGLVGKFGLSQKISGTEMVVGDSVTLEVALSGEGNVKDAKLPALNLTNIKVYEDKPKLESYKSAKGLSGKMVFKLALVPTKAGELTIPSLSLSYFNPVTEKYVQLQSEETVLAVKPGEEDVSTMVTQVMTSNGSQQIVYQDIAPIVPTIQLSKPFQLPAALFYLFIYGMPFALLILVAVRGVTSSKFRNPQKAVKKHALSKLISSLNRSGITGDQALDALRDYMTDRFSVTGQALTAKEIQIICEKRKVPADVVKNISRAIENIEAARYGFNGDAGLASEVENLIQWVKKVDQYA